jgi:hypothetical protein
MLHSLRIILREFIGEADQNRVIPLIFFIIAVERFLAELERESFGC